jgi:NAD(P)-dependent dehydrogenase (short-subunit alcohol dehydrogenase family)
MSSASRRTAGVALVTGAASGLGEAYALFLGKKGWKLVVNDKTHESAERIAAAICEVGGRAVAGAGDVSQADTSLRLVGKAVEEYGRLDAVVCNAGVVRDRTLRNMTIEDWDFVLATNLSSAFYMVKAVWPEFCKQRYGRLVLTTSVAGFLGAFGQANYATSKMALVGLMKTIALEGARYDIRANAVAPVAATGMTANVMSPDRKRRYSVAYIPPLVEFLMSPTCHLSGQVIFAGGGRYRGIETRASRGWSVAAPPTTGELEKESRRFIHVPGSSPPEPAALLGTPVTKRH